jgi:hypothetical protein
MAGICTIVEDGPSVEATIETYLAKHNPWARVMLHGWAKDGEEKADRINQSRALVLPSYNKLLRVVLETMAWRRAGPGDAVSIVPDVGRDRESGHDHRLGTAWTSPPS